MAHVVLSIPKFEEDRVVHVIATLADWTVTCADAAIAAMVEDLKPEHLGYLPFQELRWAHRCELWLRARIVEAEPPPSGGPEIPGLCFSAGEQ